MANTGVEYVLSLKDLFTGKVRQATGETEKLNSSVNKTASSFKMLGSAMAAIGGAYIIGEVVKTTAAFQGLRNQLNFAEGDAVKGGESLEWIRERAQYLGLDLNTAAQSFAKFSGAARGTSLEGQGVKDIFEGVAEAATVMHLSADEADGTFRALQQMLSKGKVSAEELNGQLGERLPGALGIASRAMGVTQAELMKMMQNGQLLSEDFLPKFAKQLKTEFAGGVETARESLTANLNRMNNSFLELKVTIGELFMPVIQAMVLGISALTNFIKEHAVALAFLGGTLAGAGAALLLYNTYLAVTNAIMAGKMVYAIWSLAAALEGTTVAQWLLNSATAFFAGLTGVGIFLVAAGAAAALAVGIYAAKSAQDSLNNSMEKQPSASTALSNPLAPKGGKQATPTAKAKGGTSTSAVESRGVQNFNISIKSLVEKLEFTTNNMKESGAILKEEVAKALIEAVNDFQLMATK